MLVVYFHSVLQIDKVFPDGDHVFMLFGKSGVDIFFVISGFIMWRSTRDKPQSIFDFYRRRFIRIAPLYWTLTMVAAAIALALPSLLKSTRLESVHLLASLAFVPWPNPASSGGSWDLMSPVIVPGWTLNFEMMFYGVFGLCLIGGVENRIRNVSIVFSVFILLLFSARSSSQIIAFYDPLLIMEFLLGIAISVAVDRGVIVRWQLAAALLVVGTVVLFVLDVQSPPITRLLTSGVPAALMIYCIISIDTAGKWPNWILMVHMGDASFSLYLTHVFVLAAFRLIWSFVFAGDSSVIGQVFFMILVLSFSCLAGSLTYRFIEIGLGRTANKILRFA